MTDTFAIPFFGHRANGIGGCELGRVTGLFFEQRGIETSGDLPARLVASFARIDEHNAGKSSQVQGLLAIE